MSFSISRSLLAALLFYGYLPLSAAVELETVRAELEETVREFLSDGTVEAINRSTITSQTSGQVEEILFDVDDYVDQGQVLVKLKNTQQKARLQQAEADLKEAVARLQEAEDEYRRVKGLHEKQLVSQSMMDKAIAALKSARARQDAASAGLIQVSEQFEYTRVKAPYSGIVTERHVQVGEIASPGQRLISGISLEQLRVLVDVPQKLISSIRKQAAARMLTADGESIEALKLTVFPYANQSSNTFKVRVDLPEGVSDLFPGMFVKAAFVTGVKQQLVVPWQSVVFRSEVTTVYVVDKDGRVHFRHIRSGQAVNDGELSSSQGSLQGSMLHWTRSPPVLN